MKKGKKLVSIFLVLALIFTSFSPTFANQGSDVKGHWAEAEIEAWMSEGLVTGYPDGSFKPNNSITRAEFMALVNRAFGFLEKSDTRYSDVKSNDWFAETVAIASAAGYVSGYQDGSVKPNAPISRQEVATILVRINDLQEDVGAVKFKDSIPQWSKGSIGAVVSAGFMNGYPSGEFAPSKSITRAEAVSTLNRNVNKSFTVYDKPGTYGPSSGSETIRGNVVIKSKDVTLQNTTVKGNLSVTSQVGEGDVTLQNVKVEGLTNINGGGENSIHIANSTLNKVFVKKSNDKVRLNVTGTSTITDVSVYSGAILEGNNGFKNVTIEAPANAKITLKGNFDTVTINSNKVNLDLPSGSSIKTLNANVGVAVTGTGRIDVANVNAEGVTFQNNPGRVNTKEGIVSPSPSKDSGSGSGGGGSSYTPPPCDTSFSGTVYCDEGTYGPTSGTQTIQGHVKVDGENITLQNLVITGNLTFGAGIGEGDVTLNNVTVQGTTHINGGGPNSIHVNDSVLITIIVNKNNGSVRIVANDGTTVQEVQVESGAILESTNRNNFGSVNVTSSVPEHADIELRGSYQTVNTIATNVRLRLPSGADINSLIVNAAAQVLGEGVVRSATINSSGVSLVSPPTETLVIAPNAGTVVIDGEETTVGSAPTAAINSVDVTLASALINLDNNVLGLTANDFELTATLDGQPTTLDSIQFHANHNRFTFSPVSYGQNDANIGKAFAVTVAPKAGTTKITGTAKTASTTVKKGFEGRITDIFGRGVSGVQIQFTSADTISVTSPDSISVTSGDTITVTTGKYGYYSVNADPSVYIGTMTKTGFISGIMDGTSESHVYRIGQNGTILQAANADQIKIALSWGENPRDLDSHLLVPLATGLGHYHIAYYDTIYRENGILYADLDWDDTSSYGPETITIYKKNNGTYRYYVHNYSRSTTFPLRHSQAKVTVYVGTSETHTFDISQHVGDGLEDYWLVFDIVVNNGNVSIVPIDQIKEIEPSMN